VGDVVNRLYNDPDPYCVAKAVSLIGSFHVGAYVDSLRPLYQKYRDDPWPDVKWAILATGANLLPSVHIDSIRQDLLDWAMADPNRLVRWYAIAVAEKFRQDLRGGLGIYQTDLTPDNVQELLYPYPTPPQLRFNTTKGSITIELDTEWAPRTARRMIAIAREGGYDHMQINNSQAGQAIQTGDRRGDGMGMPFKTVRDEYSPLRIQRGSVFWLMQTRDAGRGMFGIALTRLPYFDWRQPVIGHVVDGLENADALTAMDSILTVDVLVPEA
jgi:cyclophilin family peptidyl-prolyl cis-trans isomerase